MDTIWFEVLVIILSTFLAVVLLLTIALLIKTLQIVKLVKKITEHAEQVADRADHMSSFFEKTATPVAFMKLISNLTEVFQKKGKK